MPQRCVTHLVLCNTLLESPRWTMLNCNVISHRILLTAQDSKLPVEDPGFWEMHEGTVLPTQCSHVWPTGE